MSTGRLDRCTNAGNLMSGQIVHHDDLARPQGRDEHLLDIGQKGRTVHRAVEHHGCGQAAKSERRDKGDRLPVSMRDRCPAPLPARRPPTEPRHLRRGSSFINENQIFRVEVRLRVEPGLAPDGDVGPLLLAGVRCFF